MAIQDLNSSTLSSKLLSEFFTHFNEIGNLFCALQQTPSYPCQLLNRGAPLLAVGSDLVIDSVQVNYHGYWALPLWGKALD